MNAIEVKNLKKYFGKTHAVDDISFEVSKGEIFGFLGPNGAGKTTTIRCMMDFLRPTSGEIRILDANARANPDLKNNLGYLSGDVRLYDGWTSEDHILFLEGLRGKKSNAQKLLQDLDLNPKIKFHELSSGNKQKLGLVLVLMFSPELLIMDEPTVGLDPLLQNTIYSILLESQKQGTTIFMSSHNLAEVEKLCGRVGIIKNGKLLTIESIQALKDKRMHVVKVEFTNTVNWQEFALSNVQVNKSSETILELGVRGELNPLIAKLAQYNIKELEITHATLEDIFLEFYGNHSGEIESQNFPGTDQLQEIPRL